MNRRENLSCQSPTLELVRRAKQGDQGALLEIIEKSRGLINSAMRYVGFLTGYPLPPEDLSAVGQSTMVLVVHGFDETRGVKFTTYATKAARNEMLKACGRRPLLSRVPKGIQPDLKIISLESPVGERNNDLLVDILPEQQAFSLEELVMGEELRVKIESTLGDLSPREERVLRLRFGFDGDGPYTLQEIGDKFGLSRERIRQIEEGAINKIRENELGSLKSWL